LIALGIHEAGLGGPIGVIAGVHTMGMGGVWAGTGLFNVKIGWDTIRDGFSEKCE